MTTLVAWVAMQSDGPSAVYLASDSRITWGTPDRRWDAGRKLFASRNTADIFGFCGEVLFPSQVLGQIIDLADHGLLLAPAARAENRHAAVVAMMRESHGRRDNAPDHDFSILHVAREGSVGSAEFHAWLTSYSSTRAVWEDRPIEIKSTAKGTVSRRLIALGSGASAFVEEVIRWQASSQGGTSRAVFTSFCDALAEGTDPASGGVPQLVGLYRERTGQTFGIVHNGSRYFHGLPVGPIHYGSLEWRDDAFQRIDGTTLTLIKGAQRQVRPRFKPKPDG
jgi:hypothetical protein